MSLAPDDPDSYAYQAARQMWESRYSRVQLPSWRSRWAVRVLVIGAVLFVAIPVIGWNLNAPQAVQWSIGAAMGVVAVALLVLFLLDPWADEAEVLRRHSYLLCTHCCYPLVGLESETACPECGRPFDAEEVERFWRDYLACRREMERHAPDSGGD